MGPRLCPPSSLFGHTRFYPRSARCPSCHGQCAGKQDLVADSGYDDGKLTDKCEFRKNDKHITRRLVVPMKKHKHTSSKRLPYIRFFKSEHGQRLFRLRKITVEPMFDILKSLFSLKPVWMKGKRNVQPLLLLTVFVYQLLLLFNFVNGRPVSHVKYILDRV